MSDAGFWQKASLSFGHFQSREDEQVTQTDRSLRSGPPGPAGTHCQGPWPLPATLSSGHQHSLHALCWLSLTHTQCIIHSALNLPESEPAAPQPAAHESTGQAPPRPAPLTAAGPPLLVRETPPCLLYVPLKPTHVRLGSCQLSAGKEWARLQWEGPGPGARKVLTGRTGWGRGADVSSADDAIQHCSTPPTS